MYKIKYHLGVGVAAASLDQLQEAVPRQDGGGGGVPVAGDALQAVCSVPPLPADPPAVTQTHLHHHIVIIIIIIIILQCPATACRPPAVTQTHRVTVAQDGDQDLCWQLGGHVRTENVSHVRETWDWSLVVMQSGDFSQDEKSLLIMTNPELIGLHWLNNTN